MSALKTGVGQMPTLFHSFEVYDHVQSPEKAEAALKVQSAMQASGVEYRVTV